MLGFSVGLIFCFEFPSIFTHLSINCESIVVCEDGKPRHVNEGSLQDERHPRDYWHRGAEASVQSSIWLFIVFGCLRAVWSNRKKVCCQRGICEFGDLCSHLGECVQHYRCRWSSSSPFSLSACLYVVCIQCLAVHLSSPGMFSSLRVQN